MARRAPCSEERGATTPSDDRGPRVEALVHDLINRVAGKWTRLILEVLTEHGEWRFTRLGDLVTGTVHPVVPPKAEDRLTPLGLSLGAACCGVWAADHLDQVEQARRAFDERKTRG